MARIEPTRGPQFPHRRAEGKKISAELQQIKERAVDVAKRTHLRQFESTESTFSANPAGSWKSTSKFAGKYFSF